MNTQAAHRFLTPSSILLLLFTVLFVPLQGFSQYAVSSQAEFDHALDNVSSGETITWYSGIYSDVFMDITVDDITITAETSGEVIMTGASKVEIDGDDVTFSGFQYVGGNIGTDHVFRLYGSHIDVSDINIQNYTCYKYLNIDDDAQYATVSYSNFENRINLDDQNILSILVDEVNPGYHTIRYCSFKNFDGTGNDGGIEPIRIGVSSTSEYNSRSIIEYCYFSNCDGDGEIISNKAGQNVMRYNTFENNSLAELVLRHGSEAYVYGNFFLHNKGGIRVREGQNHYIFNNYFADLSDRAIYLQNEPSDPLDDINIYFNTVINSGEVRLGGDGGSDNPTNVTLANNLFSLPDDDLFQDETGNETWISNLSNGSIGITRPTTGLTDSDPLLSENVDGYYQLTSSSPAIDAADLTNFNIPSIDGLDIDEDILLDAMARARTASDASKDIGAMEYAENLTVHPLAEETNTGPSYLQGNENPLYIWDGNSWNNDSAPNDEDITILTGDYNSSLEGSSIETHDLYVIAGVTLTVQEFLTLVVKGDLVNKGTIVINKNASLLTSGSLEGVDFQINIGTTFDENTGQYSSVGAPIASATFADLGANAVVYGYDESEAYNSAGNQGLDRFKTPAELAISTLSVGSGYFSSFSGDENGDLLFTGIPNTGVVNVPLSYTDQGSASETDYQGFHLVSNPYPSAIDFEVLISENSSHDIDGSIYIWDDQNSSSQRGNNSDYVVINELGNTDSRSDGLDKWDGYIRSGQGFFVKCNSATQLTFNNDMRVSGNNDVDGFFRKSKNAAQSIKLLLSDQMSQKATVIGFADDATNGIDKKYDALSFNETGLQIFTREIKTGKKLGIQGLPIGYDENIPLGIKVNNGAYTISISDEVVTSPYIILHDHLEERSVNLSEEPYTFNSFETEASDRFSIQLGTILSINSIDAEQRALYMYSSSGILNIVFNSAKVSEGTIQIFDMTGRNVYNETFHLDSNRYTIDTRQFTPQIYTVLVQSEFGTDTQRIRIKR